MGTWGAGIHSDDTAADVRDEYRDCLAEGLDGAAATDRLLTLFKDSQDDLDDGPPFWLSLAATQCRYGRLEDRVRDRAIKIIDDGSDLARFSALPKLVRARTRVLEKLRAQLLGSQREPVKVRRETPSECDFEPGDVIGFQRTSGEWIPLHVQGIGENRRSRYPIVCVLDLPFAHIRSATAVTPVRRIFKMPLDFRLRAPKGWSEPNFGPNRDYFAVFGTTKRNQISKRITRTGVKVQPKLAVEGCDMGINTYLYWEILDTFLDEHL